MVNPAPRTPLHLGFRSARRGHSARWAAGGARRGLGLRLALALLPVAPAVAPFAALAGGHDGSALLAATATRVDEVEVMSVMPLPAVNLPLEQIPANVQHVDLRSLDLDGGPDLGSLLEQTVGGLSLGDTQGTTLQPDVVFRGFTASPILGTPQGLSVFVDGVRVNEAFGDTVNWDLIPRVAIAEIAVIPGSNPVFGLNTLGGAIAVVTRNGLRDPGSWLRVEGGSFGREAVELRSGGSTGPLDYFVAASYADDKGWGAHNAGRLRQAFAKVGWQREDGRVEMTWTAGETAIQGNQTIPLAFLPGGDRQTYTWPDVTRNRLQSLALNASQDVGDRASVSALAYYRVVRTAIFNSNISSDYDPTLPQGPGNPPAFDALEAIDQVRPGAALQFNSRASLLGTASDFTAGASWDYGRTDFTQSNQPAPIAADRSTYSALPAALAAALAARSTYAGAYFSEVWSPFERLHLTASGRYNSASLHLADQLGTALSGDHAWRRFNPAAGATWSPGAGFTAFAGYSEGMRAPTPVELGCADPAAPCTLPNALSADPDLKSVVSRTWEAGLRGRGDRGLAWSLAAFRSNLANDIQFVSSGGSTTSAGYFQNVGATRRQGLEAFLKGSLDRLSWRLHYSFTDATYRSALRIDSPNNSSAVPLSCATCTDIAVSPGNRLPGVPRHLLKLRVEYAAGGGVRVGLDLLAQSDLVARGDENGADVHGRVPGFALVNLDGSVDLTPSWRLYARVTNLFDRHYSTYGVLGRNVFTGPGQGFDPTGASWQSDQFRSWGPPLGFWLGVRYRFGPAA